MDEESTGKFEDGFVSIKDADGNVVAIVDRVVAEYLYSTALAPSQTSLDALLSRTTSVRVLDWQEFEGGYKKRTRLLGEFGDAKSLAELGKCMQIVEASSGGHCMCLGEEALQLRRGTEILATISLHHGRSIRWDAWWGDGVLKDGRRLLVFLARRGVSGPLMRYIRDKYAGTVESIRWRFRR